MFLTAQSHRPKSDRARYCEHSSEWSDSAKRTKSLLGHLQASLRMMALVYFCALDLNGSELHTVFDPLAYISRLNQTSTLSHG